MNWRWQNRQRYFCFCCGLMPFFLMCSDAHLGQVRALVCTPQLYTVRGLFFLQHSFSTATLDVRKVSDFPKTASPFFRGYAPPLSFRHAIRSRSTRNGSSPLSHLCQHRALE